MIIELSEWDTIGGIDLNADQVGALARSEVFGIRPDPSSPGQWQISATQFVGVAHLHNLQMRVTPKIPVHRLLELLCTSIEGIRWDDHDTHWAESNDLLTTITGSFLAHSERVLRQGLLQGYVTIEDDLYGVRGRIDLGRQITRHPGLPLPIEVSYDDYTSDIIENQLLAGAGRLLLRLTSLPPALTARLRRLEYQLVDVTATPASSSPPHVAWSRLNQRYRPAVALSRLILQSSALDFEGSGSTIGSAFLVDMNRVFEDVVGHGIRHALRADGLVTRLQRHDHLDRAKRVAIRPDVLIERHSRPIAVADVKYKRASSGVANDDVYQALSYAARYGFSGCSLIYPERPPYGHLEVGDITVRLDWLDLRQPPQERTLALEKLAERLTRPRLHSATLAGTAYSRVL